MRYEMLNIYLVCEWKLFSADDWSSDCRCHGCVSCVQFSVRMRWDLCSTLSPLPLFILPNLHMNVWVCSLLEVLTVCSQWERSKVSKEQSAATCSVRHLFHGIQWACVWQAGGEGCIITGEEVCEKVETPFEVSSDAEKPVKEYAPFF